MKELSFNEMSAIAGGGKLTCALAIAGTLCVTVGAIWVSCGAALIAFLVSKSVATAAVIEACIDLVD